MRYGEPIEAIGTEIAAGKTQLDAQIAESSEAVRAAALRALNASNGKAKGVTVADASPKGVMLKADGAKTVTYFSIPAPSVDQQHFGACIDRLIAYMQVENDELLIQLGMERLDQNKASFDARHKAQLSRIDKQIAEMRESDSASTLSKIFKWIGVAIAIAATAIAATVTTVVTCGASSPALVVAGKAIAALIAVAGIGSSTIMGLDAGGALEEIKKAKTKEYMLQGMSHAEAEKAASEIVMGLSLGSAILNAIAMIAGAVVAGISGHEHAAALAIMQAVTGIIQALQSVGSGVVDTIKAEAEYEQAVASAEVKRADARLKEVKEFLQQNVDEIQDLVERMEAHFKAYRAVIASKAATLLHLAENI